MVAVIFHWPQKVVAEKNRPLDTKVVVFLKIRPLSSSEWLEISAGDHNQTRGMCLWVALAVGMSAAPGVPHSSPGSVIVAPNSVERHAGSAREVRPSVWVLPEGAALAAFVGAHAPGAIKDYNWNKVRLYVDTVLVDASSNTGGEEDRHQHAR